jgi:hypothetical protein
MADEDSVFVVFDNFEVCIDYIIATDVDVSVFC